MGLLHTLTPKWVAAAGLTVIGSPPEMPVVPVMLLIAVSVAVNNWQPAVPNVTVNVPTPLTNVASAGSTACGSVLLK